MDPLLALLLQRQLAQGGGQDVPPPQAPLPAVPPNPPAKVPPEAKRFANAQAIQQAYAGDWTPNPVLLRAQLGHR